MLKVPGCRVLFLVLCAMLIGCAQEQSEKALVTDQPSQADTSPVVAEIGNEKITLNELDRYIKRLPLPYQERFRTGEGQKYVLDDLITSVLFSREAERLKLDQKPEVKEQLQGIKKRILSAELLRTELAKEPPPGEQEARHYYELHKKEFAKPEQVRLREIVVSTPEEGGKVLNALKKGASFTELARKKSVGPSRASGGEIGWVSRDQVNPDFAEKVFNLGKGKFSGLIRTARGYAIVLVEDKRPGAPVDYKQVETAILQRLRSEQEEKLLGEIRTRLFKEMKVTVYQDRLAEASSAEGKK